METPEAAHISSGLRRHVFHLPAVCERARQPKRGVRAGDHQRADQQRGHAPEGDEEERILLGIVVGGVSQIAGELAVRTGMALAAGGDDVVAAEMRARIVDRQNVVRAVTVVAFSGLQVTQLGDLAVERLEIRRGDLPGDSGRTGP